MWTRSDIRGFRTAAILAVLLAAAPRTGAAQELQIAVGGEVTRVPAATSRSYPAFPLTLLSRLGGKLSSANGYVVVHLFGDTLRFHEGLAQFQVNRTAVPLHHWIFAT